MTRPEPPSLAIDLLSRWAEAAEEFWYAALDDTGRACQAATGGGRCGTVGLDL